MAAAAKKPDWVMPKPPAIVVWTNAPGGTPSYAVITAVGRSAVNLMVFPPDSRIGIPKDGVRFVGDPHHKVHGINADSGVWDYTEESKQLQALVVALIVTEADSK